MRRELTAERLRELLHYDPDTGAFTWLVSRGKAKRGDVAGWPNGRGYLQVGIDGRAPSLHRPAFLWMTGAYPAGAVDHINGDGTDNRWANIRCVSASDNQRNLRCHREGKPVGVQRVGGGWQSAIRLRGRTMHILWHKDITVASDAFALVDRLVREGVEFDEAKRIAREGAVCR